MAGGQLVVAEGQLAVAGGQQVVAGGQLAVAEGQQAVAEQAVAEQALQSLQDLGTQAFQPSWLSCCLVQHHQTAAASSTPELCSHAQGLTLEMEAVHQCAWGRHGQHDD